MATGVISHPVAVVPVEDPAIPQREVRGPELEPRDRATTVATAMVLSAAAAPQEVAVAPEVGEKMILQVRGHPAMVVQAEPRPSLEPASPMAAVAVVVVTPQTSP